MQPQLACYNNGSPFDGQTTVGISGYPPVYDDALMIQPPPESVLVFIDESPVSINDGYFFLAATGDEWTDVPASRHSRGCNLSFGDSHAEHWRWQDARTVTLSPFEPTANNPDLRRLQTAIFGP